MSFKHTPGPWAVDITTNDSREAETVRGPDGVRIAATYKVHEHRIDKTAAWYESRANSKLIAAAPDLLNMLRNAENWFREYDVQNGPDSGAQLLLEDIRAAIAKATGAA